MKNPLYLLLLLLSSGVLQAGHLGYLYPAGGRAGETVEILAGGQGNWNCRDIYTGVPGIKCIDFDRNVNVPYLYNSQRNYYRKYLEAKFKKRPIPPKPEKQDDWRKNKMIDEIDTLSPARMDLLLRALYTRPNALQISPSINQKCILKVEIAPDVKPGIYYLRLQGRGVLTNPIPFVVGNAPEVLEPGYRVPYQPVRYPEFAPPANLNGQIRPGETDIFKVRLKAHTAYYFKLYGRFFKPYVGDGVPGFFQPILELKNAAGKQVAIAERNGVDIDPLMICSVPEDGEYTLSVRDALYRGREDFVYRIECGIGAPPRQKIDFKLPPLPRKTYLPGMTADSPVLVTGELDPGMRLAIRIPGKKGEKKVFETFARKIGSTLDTVLRLYSPNGKLLAENDDTTPEILLGNAMHFADSHLQITFPEDGDYLLEMMDRAQEKGPFALRIDRPRPDFQLMIAPSGMETNRAGHFVTTLFIRRIEGFDGPITLTLSGSKTLRLSGNNTVPLGATLIPVSFHEPSGGRIFLPERLTLTGSANTPDGKITRKAIAADPAMQAFAYTHYIIAPELLHASSWRIPGHFYTNSVPCDPIRLRPGSTHILKYTVHNLPANAAFQPPRLILAPAWLTAEKPEIVDRNPKRKQFTLAVKLHIAKEAPAGADIAFAISLPFQYTITPKDQNPRIRKNALPLPAMRINIERIRP